MLQLIPVIEFEPGKFQSEDSELWNMYDDDDPKGWNNYWRNSLSESGITNLEPYETNSWLVETNKLTSEIVEVLLKKTHEIEDDSITDPEEMGVGPLSGGYVLEVSDTVQITPNCCGGLENIKDWEEASNWMDTKETDLWIGHPQLYVKSLDCHTLQIRRTAEYGEPEEPVFITIDRHELKAAITDARKQLEIFRQVILFALPNVFPHLFKEYSSPLASEIANILVYGW